MSSKTKDKKLIEISELRDYLEAALSINIKKITIEDDILRVYTASRRLHKVLNFLRDDANCDFKTLTNIFAVDYLEEEERFEINYHLLSITLNQRIVVSVTTDGVKVLKSVCSIYDSALWYEREIWDMFGICFAENPDLRRIFNQHGFKDFPLRKDYSLYNNADNDIEE